MSLSFFPYFFNPLSELTKHKEQPMSIKYRFKSSRYRKHGTLIAEAYQIGMPLSHLGSYIKAENIIQHIQGEEGRIGDILIEENEDGTVKRFLQEAGPNRYHLPDRFFLTKGIVKDRVVLLDERDVEATVLGKIKPVNYFFGPQDPFMSGDEILTLPEQESLEKVDLHIGLRNYGAIFELEKGVYINLIDVSEDYLKSLGYPLLNKLLEFFCHKGDFLNPLTNILYLEDYLDALFGFSFKGKEEDGVVPDDIAFEEINKDTTLLHLRQYVKVDSKLKSFKYSFMVQDYTELSFRDVVNAVIKLKRVVDTFCNG